MLLQISATYAVQLHVAAVASQAEILLSAAARYPAAEAAVRAALPFGVLDPARLRRAGAPCLLDTMRVCSGPRAACLAQVVDNYVEYEGA